jgi:precorrin-8X/cobalt-precorrin-8 methylmutase
MSQGQRTGILIVSHGSPRAQTNHRFEALVARIAARLGSADVLATFFSIARPNIPDQVAVLAGRGVRRIVLMPHFLGEGQHVTKDIPELLDVCRRSFPDVTLEVLPTLENEPALEDLVVDRLLAYADPAETPLGDAKAIERRSFEIIDRQLADWPATDEGTRSVIRRVVHATADVSYARTLRFHPQAVARGRAALAERRLIVCDVKMLQAGITRTQSEVLSTIDWEEAALRAKQRSMTRAAAAIEIVGPRLEGAIVAVGNAPTALVKVIELARSGGPRPALVVGLPVGLVGARESKLALLASDLCYITNTTSRGGSPVAAAVINALALAEG